MSTLETELPRRLERAENPAWYLKLLGTALEQGADPESALSVADAAVRRNPQPPDDPLTAAMKAADDRAALDAYIPPRSFRGGMENRLKSLLMKGKCRPGETVAETDCTPGEGSGGKKPVGRSVAVDAVKDLMAKWGEKQGSEPGLTPRDICEGSCSLFAYVAVRAIQQKLGRPVVPAIRGQAHENETRDVHTSRTNMDADGEGHMWVTAFGRHYDPEAPEGVDDPMDLPWFKRHPGFRVLPAEKGLKPSPPKRKKPRCTDGKEEVPCSMPNPGHLGGPAAAGAAPAGGGGGAKGLKKGKSTNAQGHQVLTGYVQVRARIATTSGGSKERTFWARKTSSSSKATMYRVVDNQGGAKNEVVALGQGDLVWEKPAVYNLHYDEMELEKAAKSWSPIQKRDVTGQPCPPGYNHERDGCIAHTSEGGNADERESTKPGDGGGSDGGPAKLGAADDAGDGGADGGGGEEKPGKPGDKILVSRKELTKPADPGLVPESVRKHLNAHQVQGVAKAIDALQKHGGFLLSDGTGTGKTRSLLGTAQHFLEQGKKVLIVCPAGVIKPKWGKGEVAGSFNNDSKAMGVKFKLSNGNGDDPLSGITMSTYENLSKFKDKVDKDTIVLYDESHMLKNASSARAMEAHALNEKAGGVMYATATPLDHPFQIAYLFGAKVFGHGSPDDTYHRLGLIKKTSTKTDPLTGEKTVKVKWEISPNVGAAECFRRVYGLFDKLTEEGLMLKREISMKGVTIDFHQVSLPPGAYEEIQKAGLLAASKVKNPLLKKALLLAVERRFQEPYKIKPTVDMVKEEMAAGRQVVIFASRVNETEVKGQDSLGNELQFKSEGTLQALKKALHAQGITEVSELHGSASTDPKMAMDDFQSGKSKVMIATIESGGTGVNLDDTKGDAPRTVIMMTPPFSGMDNVQALGRVWRLNTKSLPKIRYLLADTTIDDWNVGIVQRKLGALRASVQGKIKLVPPGSDPELDAEDLIGKKGPFAWPKLTGAPPKKVDAAKLPPVPQYQGSHAQENVAASNEMLQMAADGNLDGLKVFPGGPQGSKLFKFKDKLIEAVTAEQGGKPATPPPKAPENKLTPAVPKPALTPSPAKPAGLPPPPKFSGPMAVVHSHMADKLLHMAKADPEMLQSLSGLPPEVQSYKDQLAAAIQGKGLRGEVRKGFFSTIQDAGRWLAEQWEAGEHRYGRAGALTMAASMLATMPVPGNVLAIIAAAEAIRGLTGFFKREMGGRVEDLKGFGGGVKKETCTPGHNPGRDHCTMGEPRSRLKLPMSRQQIDAARAARDKRANTKIPESVPLPKTLYLALPGDVADRALTEGHEGSVKGQLGHEENRRDSVYMTTDPNVVNHYAGMYGGSKVLAVDLGKLDRDNLFYDAFEPPNESGKAPFGDDNPGYVAYRGTLPASALRLSEEHGSHASVKSNLEAGLSHLPPAVQREYRANLHRVIDGMSAKAAERLRKHVKQVRFHADLPTLNAHLKSSASPEAADRIEKLMASGRLIGGSYDPGSGAVHVNGPYHEVQGGEPLPPAHGYAHEFAHGIDGPDKEISGSPEWRKAASEEIDATSMTRYATTRPSEAFAEFGRLVLASGQTRKEIEARFPRCSAVWAKWELWKEGAEKGLNGAVRKGMKADPALPEIFIGAPVDVPSGHLDLDPVPGREMDPVQKERKPAPKKPPRRDLVYNYLTDQVDVEMPALISWIAGDPSKREFVQYYNHTGTVMHFTHDVKQAYRTTDLADAKEWARIANDVYRRNFHAMGAHQWGLKGFSGNGGDNKGKVGGGSLSNLLTKAGFTGKRTDKLGRNRCYRGGHPVPCNHLSAEKPRSDSSELESSVPQPKEAGSDAEVQKSYVEDAAKVAASELTERRVQKVTKQMAAKDARWSAIHAKVVGLVGKAERLSKAHDREVAKFQKMLDAHGDRAPDAYPPEVMAQAEKVDAACGKWIEMKKRMTDLAWKEVKRHLNTDEQGRPIPAKFSDSLRKVTLQMGPDGLLMGQKLAVKAVEDRLSGCITRLLRHRIEETRVFDIPAGKKQRAFFSGTRHGSKEQGIYLPAPSTGAVPGKEEGWLAATVAHELGHSLETNAQLHAAAQGFLHKRVGKEEAKPMGGGYDAYEVGRDDEFAKAFGMNARYVGKHYKSDDTEVVSMGLEKMYSDPVDFAVKDPEYFKFMLGVLDGSFV